MLKILIQGVEVTERPVPGKLNRSGGPLVFREQRAYAYLSDRNGKPFAFPSPVVVNVPDGAHPYAEGVYTLAASSYGANQYGALELRGISLVPLAEQGSPARKP